MRLSHVGAYQSIKPGEVDGVELPSFVVLTGENGSGKTHLLRGISEGAIQIPDLAIDNIDVIRLVEANKLVPRASRESQQPMPVRSSVADYRDTWSATWEQVRTVTPMPRFTTGVPGEETPTEEDSVRQQLVTSGFLTQAAVDRLAQSLGERPFRELTVDEFFRLGPLLPTPSDLFEHDLYEVFVIWAMRKKANKYRQMEANVSGDAGMSDAQFEERFGGPPWEAVNTVLRGLKLPYQYLAPDTLNESLPIQHSLRHDEGHDVPPSSLSGGEQTLLAIAQSLFTASSLLDSTKLPKMMLFDEPDATLHPSMVKRMLDVFRVTFADELGIRVMMTTHSPSTVALAPEQSLMVMSRSVPRLSAVSTDKALAALTVGLPTLSVRIENQRQVFVEAPIDQRLYQGLFSVLQPHIGSERTPVFIASAPGDDGAGSARVKLLVNELRTGGVETVRGILDRDAGRSGGTPAIHFISDRYAIENLLLDPLLVGAFLLHETHLRATDLGLPESTSYSTLNGAMAQSVITHVCAATGLAHGDTTQVDYVGGYAAEVPNAYLDKRGHDLFEPLMHAFHPLWAYSAKGKTHDDLLKDVLRKVVQDRVEFVPLAAVQLFRSVLE